MEELCILFGHYQDDEVTRAHLRLLHTLNPYPIIPICSGAASAVSGAVDVAEFAGRYAAESRHHGCDLMLYLWFRHRRSVDAIRYAYIEWDTLATQPLREFYREVWNEDAAGSQVKSPHDAAPWPWFRSQTALLPEPLRAFAAGLVPFNGVLLSHCALTAISGATIPPNIFCELRLGTLLRSSGFSLSPFPAAKARNNNWRSDLITVSREPSLYHPVKYLTGSAPQSSRTRPTS